MPTRLAVTAVMVCACAWAQGTRPKTGAAEYAAHADLKDGAIGAENLGHSLAAAKGVTLVRDYLVVEVALYARNAPVKMRNEQFLLRINGRKAALGAQTAGMVAASLKYPDWESRPTLVAGGGIGNAGVVFGQPDPVERFPGDHRPAEQRRPVPNPVPPAPTDSSGVEQAAPEPVEDVVNHLALPEGDIRPPVSGYLFFPFKDKLKSIKTLDLVYEGPLGAATLRLP